MKDLLKKLKEKEELYEVLTRTAHLLKDHKFISTDLLWGCSCKACQAIRLIGKDIDELLALHIELPDDSGDTMPEWVRDEQKGREKTQLIKERTIQAAVKKMVEQKLVTEGSKEGVEQILRTI